eukprot:TRINITY_DN8433_c0_g1_i1.p1 TRINITY_DN8433_c0_g1~~TRINITY_DN8433_c0_g1_i1.p1  ORF type:complete len:610 (-),score=148.97 TRINITY_DN8433_c0_g1_i1:241-2070(-)
MGPGGTSWQEDAAARRDQTVQNLRSGGSARSRSFSAKGARRSSANVHDGGSPARHRSDFRSRVEAWQIRHKALMDKQEQARREKENREMEDCTFKPKLNTKSEFYARRSRGCYLEPLAERLHHEADMRAVLRQKAKELLEADEMCAYSFQPKINSRPSSAGPEARTPIHRRTEMLRRQKQEQAKAAQEAEDRRTECSFRPKISERSEKIVQKRRDDTYRSVSQGDPAGIKMLGKVEDRLYAEAQVFEQRRAMRAETASEGGSVCAPSVDQESRRICKSSIYFQGPQQDFLTRQQTFEAAKQKRMEVRAQRVDSDCTFAPEISEYSRQLVSSNLDYVGETTEDRIERLAKRDVERREQLRGALEQVHYRECTFRPSVNAVSQALATRLEDMDYVDGLGGGPSVGSASEMSVHERLYRTHTQQRQRMTERAGSQPRFGEDCTFQPQVDSKKRFSHIKAHYPANGGSRIMENIREELMDKEELLAFRRREVEDQERAECTFVPSTCRPYEEPQRPVAVSGLGRFFELRGLAQKQQREQKERESRVFHLEAPGTRCGGVTIQEPFELSSARRVSRERAPTRDEEECTFSPWTNESVNRQLVRQIMSTTSPSLC